MSGSTFYERLDNFLFCASLMLDVRLPFFLARPDLSNFRFLMQVVVTALAGGSCIRSNHFLSQLCSVCCMEAISPLCSCMEGGGWKHRSSFSHTKPPRAASEHHQCLVSSRLAQVVGYPRHQHFVLKHVVSISSTYLSQSVGQLVRH